MWPVWTNVPIEVFTMSKVLSSVNVWKDQTLSGEILPDQALFGENLPDQAINITHLESRETRCLPFPTGTSLWKRCLYNTWLQKTRDSTWMRFNKSCTLGNPVAFATLEFSHFYEWFSIRKNHQPSFSSPSIFAFFQNGILTWKSKSEAVKGKVVTVYGCRQ